MNAALPRASAAAHGLSAEALDTAVRSLVDDEELELNSFMVWHEGAVVYERWWWPAAPDHTHMLHSATKGFVGLATGLAIADGVISREDRVTDILGDFVPENRLAQHDPGDGTRTPEASDYLHEMTIGDLLTMRSGHATGLSGSATRLYTSSVVGNILAEPVPVKPGTRFVYSSASSHLLSAAVHTRIGRPISEYLAERVFTPLGIDSFAWGQDPDGFCTGGNGLALRTEDFVKVGALILAEGRWHGEQLIPAEWVRSMSRDHVAQALDGAWDGNYFVPVEDGSEPGENAEAYGLHWGVLPGQGIYTGGIFGQYSFVLPEVNAVVAYTGSITNWRHRSLPELTIEHVVPALRRQRDSGIVVRGPAGGRTARDASPNDAVGEAGPPRPALRGRSLELASRITEISIDFTVDGVHLALHDLRGTHLICADYQRWAESRTDFSLPELHHSYEFDGTLLLARSGWVGDELVVRLLYPETAFRDTLRFTFSAGAFALHCSTDVNTGRTELPLQTFATGD